jgi:DNA-binding NarL/FixJ family response regulator
VSAAPVVVLVVDDHLLFAEGVARLLGDEPDVTVARVVTDPGAVLPAVEALAPDVVLLDHHMPGRDGATLVADIVEVSPHTHVVLLTGSADDDVLVTALRAGASGVLTKDRAGAEVVAAVRSVHRGESVVPAALIGRLLPRLDSRYRVPGSDLTPREREVLSLMAGGATNAAVADRMGLSVNTVRNYVQSILAKLDAHSKLEAVAFGLRAGIVDLPVAAGR